jgi:hypothetical protein
MAKGCKKKKKEEKKDKHVKDTLDVDNPYQVASISLRQKYPAKDRKR